MKPTSMGLLCLACCFASVGTAYLMFEMMHEAPAKQVAASTEDSLQQDRVADLERQISALKEEVNGLRNQQPAIFRVTDDDDDIAPAGVDSEPSEVSTPAAKAQAGVLAELADRITEIESGETAARTLRERAILELNGEDARQRNSASNLLAELAKAGDKQAQQALIDSAKSEDPGVRNEAIEAMGKTGMVEFLPALVEATDDENTGVRDEAAESLRKLPPNQAGPVLVGMLDDTETRVLREAIDAIGDIGYVEGAAALRSLTSHQDEGIAVEASLALKQLGDPSGAEAWVPTFGMRLNSTDVAERRGAVRNLRRLRMESARAYLEQALNDADSRVKRDAQRALNDLNKQNK